MIFHIDEWKITQLGRFAYLCTTAELGRPEDFEDTNADGEYTTGEAYVDTNGNSQWDADRGVSDSFGLSGDAVEAK